MIQAAITQAQQEKSEALSEFKKLNEQIKHITKKLGGESISEQTCLCEYSFAAENRALSKHGKFDFRIKCSVRNQIITILVEMSLKQCWKEVSSFGSINLSKVIKKYNSVHQYLYQFNEPLKQITAKIYYHHSKMTLNFDKLINSMFELTYPIINPSKYNLKHGKKKLEYLADMLEVLRQRQQKSTQMSNIRRLSFSKVREQPLAHQNSGDIERFQRITEKYEDELFRKFEKEQGIFRCIKEIEGNKDTSWGDQELGANSLVEKLLLKYSINQQSSINSQANKQIKNTMKCISQSQKDQSKKVLLKEVTKQSWLVKKKPNSQGQTSFEVEKKVLLFLRGLKCYSLNSYYTEQISNPDQMKYFYSDYHERKLFDEQLDSVKSYFKAFLTLCQGLVFLRENAISHRDLKPDNILLAKNLKAKIIDFGSACHNKLYFNDPERRRMKERCQEAQQIISSQIQTSQQYNLTYFSLEPSVRAQFTYDEFNSHPYFDMYAFGVLLSDFMDSELVRFEVGSYVWKALHYLSDLCQEQNPDDRPDPLHAYVFLAQFVKLIQIDCE